MSNELSRPTLGDVVRARRLQLGFTQEKVATAVGWKRSEMVGLVETGRRMPGLDRIPALADALQLEPFELCRVALAEYPALYAAVFGPVPLVSAKS